MTPDRLLVRFDAKVKESGTARVIRIDVDKHATMTVHAKVAGRLRIRSNPANSMWGWEAILAEWRDDQRYYEATVEVRAS